MAKCYPIAADLQTTRFIVLIGTMCKVGIVCATSLPPSWQSSAHGRFKIRSMSFLWLGTLHSQMRASCVGSWGRHRSQNVNAKSNAKSEQRQDRPYFVPALCESAAAMVEKPIGLPTSQ